MSATPSNITALSRAANVVTVAYQAAFVPAIAVGESVWIQNAADATFNGIYTVASVPTTTSLTFAQQGNNTTATVAGTVTLTKNFVVLTSGTSQGGQVNITVEFWFPVVSGSELPSGTAFNRAVADETAAFSVGRLTAEIVNIPFPDSYSTASMELFIQALYSSKALYRANKLSPGAFYGFFFDGVGWARA